VTDVVFDVPPAPGIDLKGRYGGGSGGYTPRGGPPRAIPGPGKGPTTAVGRVGVGRHKVNNEVVGKRFPTTDAWGLIGVCDQAVGRTGGAETPRQARWGGGGSEEICQELTYFRRSEAK
jgi:hypothetical protein